MIYIQKDGNSKGMKTEIVKEDDYRMTLKILESNMVFSLSKTDFKKHYLDEAGEEPKVQIVFGKAESDEIEDKPKSGFKRKGKSAVKSWLNKYTKKEDKK